ncbi:MAG: NADH-quinone oxidoreductase subunit M [Coxiellaceae bacterium]|nr:NADH-quinone oxidoreductase subunit M [Coxiellaceae bacterium]|tara:strand:- start:2423 stop:3943 length:1521 start_codon:yes stop_codon:yes gene_type:complete
MLFHLPLLSCLIWVSALGAIPVLAYSGADQANKARWIALFISLLTVVLSAMMILQFNSDSSEMQFVEQASWIPSLKIDYHLGVDGLSVPLIALTCFTTVVVVLASWTMVTERVAQYLAAFLVMQGMVIGVFASIDAILFYFFWEGMLIPMYLSIGIWGSKNRSYAAIKFFLYTFLGSALLLIIFLYLRMAGGDFNILHFQSMMITRHIQDIIFFGFLIGFAVKVPMWPFHTWLPDAHTEAPTGGSVVLAALMLKIGAYGFLRFSLPIVPDACHHYVWLMLILSLISVIYVGMVALVQTDMKKLIAYSSISHMGFVTLGCFIPLLMLRTVANMEDAYMSLEGAMVQMIAHAFGSGAMFLGFGILYQQLQSRNIEDMGGITKTMPYFTAFFMVFCMSNVGLPGTSGFVGEFMIIISAFKANVWIALFAASTLFIGASYTLLMFKRVFYGPVANDKVAALKDIGSLDKFNFVLLTAAILYLGLYPNGLLNLLHASVDHLLQLSMSTKIV